MFLQLCNSLFNGYYRLSLAQRGLAILFVFVGMKTIVRLKTDTKAETIANLGLQGIRDTDV